MYCCPVAFSPSAFRSTEMLWLRLFSSTVVSGQTVARSSSLVTSRPAFSTSTQSVSNTFRRKGMTSVPRESRRSRTSS